MLFRSALFLHDLRLPAFSPHDQRLTLDRTSLLFNLSRQGAAAWQVRQLRLESPLANLDLHGALQPGESDFTAQAALALPLLSEGLRVRLALYPDAKITDGRLQCSMQARGPGERLSMALDCRISDIHAERGGADIVWANPLTLPVFFERIAQDVFNIALVLGVFHVDEVDDDQTAQVAQAHLACVLISVLRMIRDQIGRAHV